MTMNVKKILDYLFPLLVIKKVPKNMVALLCTLESVDSRKL